MKINEEKTYEFEGNTINWTLCVRNEMKYANRFYDFRFYISLKRKQEWGGWNMCTSVAFVWFSLVGLSTAVACVMKRLNMNTT